VLSEYRDVLTRGKFAFDAALVEELLWFLEAAGEPTLAPPQHLNLPDPADPMFIEEAVSSRADRLVTGNLKHFPESACQGICIVTPGQLLDELEPR
jgi:uncharacterized protein